MLKKIRFSSVSIKDDLNNKIKDPGVQFFDNDFDAGREFKEYFPQFNLGNVLAKLNLEIELKSRIYKVKPKSPKRFHIKK